MSRRIRLSFIALVAFVSTALAQPSSLLHREIIFDQLPVSLGLSQGMINTVLQDREGFLWVATYSGLFRYDGYGTKSFPSANLPGKLRSNKITSLYEDVLGDIWIGTQMEGVFRFDKNAEVFTQFKNDAANPASLSNNNVWTIQEDGDGNLWVGTEDGLNLLDRKANGFRIFQHHDNDGTSLSSSHISDLFRASDNSLWVGTSGGVNLLQHNARNNSYSFKHYIYTAGPAQNRGEDNYVFKIRELMLQGKRTIWFTTSHGLKKIADGKIENYFMEGKGQSYSTMFCLLPVEGSYPYILIGSVRGLNFFDPLQGKFTRLLSVDDERSNLSHGFVTAIFIDRSGVLWVGTKDGLNKADSYSKNFDAYSTASFDKTRSVTTGVRGTPESGYIVSTLGGGLFLFKDGKFKHIAIAAAKDNDFLNYVQFLYMASDESIWLGTVGNGVYHFRIADVDPRTGVLNRFEHYGKYVPLTISSDFPMSIVEDRTGNVWVGSWHDGLDKITPDKKVIPYNDSLLAGIPLVAMYADKDNRLWVGTSGNGLYSIDISHATLDITRYAHDKHRAGSLVNNFVTAIAQDRRGQLWIGTQEGPQVLDPNTATFTPVTPGNRAYTPVVAGIEEDNNGRIWLAHDSGLSVVDPGDSTYIKHYSYHDRIQGGFLLNNISFKDKRGRLFFGGSEGFNIIEPTSVVVNPTVTKAELTDFQLFGNSVSVGSTVNGRVIMPESLSKTTSICLEAKENSIAFEFAALDYAAPEKIHYAYKLEGFDQEWKYTNSSRRFAIYTNLNEGTYTFNVKASNNEGTWSDQVRTLSIVINPPWWKTTWARTLFLVVLIFTFYLFRRLTLLRANFMHDLKLERLQRESMEKLNHAKLQFFTNVSHEFRTPLTLIMGPLQTLIDGKEREPAEREELLRINTNANRLLRLANQLLDFRKVESGSLALKVSQYNVVAFAQEIKLSFDALAKNLGIDFSIRSSSAAIPLWFDPDQVEKIMFNLLSNAFKHTPAGGKITLEIDEREQDVVLFVEDNGRGIKREHFENIFQAFFSYEEDKHHNGTGIGLALAKSLVERHHGQLSFESEENVLTRFTIVLKKGSAHFDPTEISPVSRDLESMDLYPSLHPHTIEPASELVDSTEETDLPRMLIVEDNDEVRAYIRSIFRDVYAIQEASNGQRGIDLALATTPDIIVSDVMMPEVDGISLCAQLKVNIKTSHIPIVLLTARTSLIFKVEGLETGADDYITKPFNPQLLRLKVRNLIHTREVMKKLFQDNKVLNIEPSKVTLNSTDEVFLKHALESVERNMSNPDYGIDDLCKEVAMGRSQLYTKLKGLTGQSGNEFIRTLRLKRAAQLLEQNQLTIAEVTNWVGFTDLQYFRDCFKKMFGVVPSEYAKSRGVKQPSADPQNTD